MKIVIINGQNHKGITYNMAKLVVDKITAEKEVTEFFLPKDLNRFCMGCYACLKERTACPFQSEKQPILDAMISADLIILTSPTYCMMPSAPMKAFLDLFFTNWLSHKPIAEMFGKRALVVSSAAGAGSDKTCKLMKTNLENWGIPQIKTLAVNANATSWQTVPTKKLALIQKKTDKLAAYYSKNCSKAPKITLKLKIMFGIFAGMQSANWGAAPEEKQYWSEKGWLEDNRPWKSKK